MDGGRTWAMQSKNPRPAAFFDAMAFWARDRGVAVSDPVGGKFLVITTADGGRTWAAYGPEGFHSASFVGAEVGWAVGEGGRVAKYTDAR